MFNLRVAAKVELALGDPDSTRIGWLFDALWRRRTNRNPFLDQKVPEDVRRLLSLSAQLERTQLQWVDDTARVRFLTTTAATADLEDDDNTVRTAERREWVGGRRVSDGVPSIALGPRSSRRASGVRDLAATPADEPRPLAELAAAIELQVVTREQPTTEPT